MFELLAADREFADHTEPIAARLARRPGSGVDRRLSRAATRSIRWIEVIAVYEKDGEKYFVVDSHMHYWNAAPDNWVPGAEQYAKGWIECFHAYHRLAPRSTHWPIEKFQKYSEADLMESYREGFNPTERNAALGEQHPGRFVVNTRWDPREGDDGLKTLAHNV